MIEVEAIRFSPYGAGKAADKVDFSWREYFLADGNVRFFYWLF
ncbi:MAG: hypothetical protein ACOX37_12520 [Bacillota bacterium]